MGPISQRTAILATVLGVAVSSAALATPAYATPPANVRCATAKRRAAVDKLRAIETCFAKRPTDTQPPDPTCLANAERKLQQQFAKIESRGGCMPATGDEPGAQRLVDQCEAGLVRFLPGTCLPGGTPCVAGSPPCCSGVCISRIGEAGVCAD